MRLSPAAHTERPWRIHELTRDFRLEDVWALPTPGGPDDFGRLVAMISAAEPSGPLWTVREKLGALLGLDGEDDGLGARVASLRERMTPDLRGAPRGPAMTTMPFHPLYLLADEWAAELANRTVHGVLHLGWVEDGDGAHRGQMAILVKPNGLLGRAYMAAIKPFRHLLVYPAMLGGLERDWATAAARAAASARVAAM